MDEKLPPPSPQEQEQRLKDDRITRRTLLMQIGLLLNAAVAVVIAVPVVRYLLGPVRDDDEYRKWISLGNVDDFKVGDTVLVSYLNPIAASWDGETQKIPAYVRRSGEREFTVFAVNCAHLNCPVRWFAESQLFMCPCHGGVYYANGERASGPPERGLFKYESKTENGKLFIKAGQMPTLSNRAKLIREIAPCPGTNGSMAG
ncbi:MAG: Rieske 2Fe-2S domain-containing protein [Candidatus Angelobacter sp.]